MVEGETGHRAITLRLPEAQHEALRTLAFVEGTSINELVLRAVRSYLTAQHRVERFESLLDRARLQYRELLGREEVTGAEAGMRAGVRQATAAGLQRAKLRLTEVTSGYEEQLDELGRRAQRVRDLAERDEIQRLIEAARAGYQAAAERLAQADPPKQPPNSGGSGQTRRRPE
jgi:uncharacterized protein (DUF1778 family)